MWVIMQIIEDFLPLAHYDERAINPSGILIHYLSAITAHQIFRDLKEGEYDPFDVEICRRIMKHYDYSAHFMIGRKGRIFQWVPLHNRAHHAGTSVHNGKWWCNNWMYGIEFASTGKPYDGEPAYTDAQYESGRWLIAWLMAREPNITVDNITGHDKVRQAAIDAGKLDRKKYDPGPLFDYDRVLPKAA